MSGRVWLPGERRGTGTVAATFASLRNRFALWSQSPFSFEWPLAACCCSRRRCRRRGPSSGSARPTSPTAATNSRRPPSRRRRRRCGTIWTWATWPPRWAWRHTLAWSAAWPRAVGALVVSLAWLGFRREGRIPRSERSKTSPRPWPTRTTSCRLPCWRCSPCRSSLPCFSGGRSCAAVCPLGAVQELVAVRPIRTPRWLDHVLGLLPYIYLAPPSSSPPRGWARIAGLMSFANTTRLSGCSA